MKKVIIYSMVCIGFGCGINAGTKNVSTNTKTSEVTMENIPAAPEIYKFKVTDISGAEFDFSSLKGKKIMIVNTASECGLTPQYEQLEEIYKTYGGEKFTIIGFPANNFGAQEPGSNEEIKGFCTKNYGVTFPMMAKVSVKGDDQAPIYKWLTHKAENGIMDVEVTWNFQKFLIDEKGHFVKSVSPKTLPNDESIIEWIKK